MCGIVGAYPLNRENETSNDIPLVDGMGISEVVLKMLRLNRNRGQDGYGLSILTDKKLTTTKFEDIKSEEAKELLNIIPYEIKAVLGHARYPTSGKDSGNDYMQPFDVSSYKEIGDNGFSFAFNGNIANSDDLKIELEKKGYEFKMDGLDTEVLKFMMLDLIENGTTDFKLILENIMTRIDGSCNISLINKKGEMAIAKDLNDFHPLSWVVKDGVFLFSSESSAIRGVGGRGINYLKAGEIVEIKNGKLFKGELRCETNKTPCVFEKIYFSDSRSMIGSRNTSSIRYSLGYNLAKEEKNIIDTSNSVVVEVPASSHHQSHGFAEELNIANIPAIIKNPNIGSTFIEKKSKIKNKVKMKYIFNSGLRQYIEGKDVFLVDDSIVRGSTMSYLVEEFRRFYNPKNIHIRIPSPPVVAPCFYGINMSTTEELLATKYIKNLQNPTLKELEKMSLELGSDSLSYLSLDGLSKVIPEIEVEKLKVKGACMACLTGIYPTKKGIELYNKQKDS